MFTQAQKDVAAALVGVYKGWVGKGFGNGPIGKLVKSNRFAFLVAVILDGGGVSADQAWQGMANFAARLKRKKIPFTPSAVATTHLATLKVLAAEKPCIHKYHANMARFIKKAARRIVDDYGGDADELFDAFTAREVFFRLMEFEGIGDKRANMAVRLLVDELGEKYRDAQHMNVPVDVQVERVFQRAGLAGANASRTEIQQTAARLNPDAPWALDSAWHVGYTWCTASARYCDGDPAADEGTDQSEFCPLSAVCPRLP